MSSTFSSWVAAELGVRVGAGDQRVQLVDRDRLVLGRGRGDRDDLLREHVERVARDDRRLDLALAHPPGDDRALEQVGAELREDPAAADGADRVPGAADPLQPARHRLRRLDLDHEVDRAHVDPELERRGRDQARQLAGLQHLLDDEPLLARERAVVGAGDLVARRQLVQPQREPLGGAAVVDEHDRRAVRLDQLEQLRVDRRPDRAAGRLAARERVEVGRGRRRRARPSTRPAPGSRGRAACGSPVSTIRHVRDGPTRKRPISSSGFCVADSPIRWTSCPAASVEPLERQRQVRAALGRRHRVDLVDDAPPRAGEQLLGAAEVSIR